MPRELGADRNDGCGQLPAVSLKGNEYLGVASPPMRVPLQCNRAGLLGQSQSISAINRRRQMRDN